MTETTEYDLFIVYNGGDAEWVEDVLVPGLKVTDGRILTKEGFRPGADKITEFERAVASSRYTLLILSPGFFADVWTQYSESIVSYCRAIHRRNCLLPLILHNCELPLRIEKVVPFDCTDEARWQVEIERLRNFLAQPESPLGHFSYPSNLPPQLTAETGSAGKAFDKNAIIETLEEQAFYLNIHFSPEVLTEQVYFASASLASWPNTFFQNCPPLERREVRQIIDWIQPPVPDTQPPVLMVTGKAGAGKSVILRNVLEVLREERIPVLGLKADEQHDIQALELPEGVKATLIALIRHYGKAVVLFDQIDALSLSSSSNRQALNAYLHLIRQLSLIHNLRIVISCRTYDLKTDPFLQTLNTTHIIEVDDLQKEEIVSVLSGLGMIQGTIPAALLDLLKVPLHLKVFADIYHENTDFSTLKTLQDLYKALWERRILSITPNDHILDAIETITNRMDAAKSLNVPFDLLDRNDAARRHLLSYSILIEQGNQLQFFHQTFFDYCYARTFLSRHDSLIEAILPQQGLFVRSQVKQILNYLRGSFPQMYLKELQAFLTHKKLQFHLRLLVINQLGFVEDPTDEEWRIVKPLLDSDPEFTLHFLEALNSEQWLKYVIDYGYIHEFLSSSDDRLFNLAIWKLRSFIDRSTEIVINFLGKFPSIEHKDECISGILLSLTHWEAQKAIELFEQYLSTIKTFSEPYPYYQILESVLSYQPERICQIFFDDIRHKVEAIPSANEFDRRNIFDYHDINLFQKIREHEEIQNIVLFEGCEHHSSTHREDKIEK